MTLPTCRAALIAPDARPARSPGALSMTAVVAAGIVNAMPNPAATRGATSSG
jgi:hypothetical protein